MVYDLDRPSVLSSCWNVQTIPEQTQRGALLSQLPIHREVPCCYCSPYTKRNPAITALLTKKETLLSPHTHRRSPLSPFPIPRGCPAVTPSLTQRGAPLPPLPIHKDEPHCHRSHTKGGAPLSPLPIHRIVPRSHHTKRGAPLSLLPVHREGPCSYHSPYTGGALVSLLIHREEPCCHNSP